MRAAIVGAALFLAAGAEARAQAVHDSCVSAVPVTEGVEVVSSNAGATTGPEPVACGAANDVWFSFVPACDGQFTASTCSAATTFDTVLALWSAGGGCGSLVLAGCNDDNCGIPGLVFASRVTFTASAGVPFVISVGGMAGATGSFGLRVTRVVSSSLSFFDAGPGTLGYQVTGPANGAFFVAMTTLPGAFPFGWFHGVDIALADLVAQYAFGPPFVGAFPPCGPATFGPVFGVPSGLTVYAVALAFAPGAPAPSFTSNPAVGIAP